MLTLYHDRNLSTLKYFDKKSLEEDHIIKCSDEVQEQYLKIDHYFQNFFDNQSLQHAKEKSKSERDLKGLTDTSFVYGEVVRFIL